MHAGVPKHKISVRIAQGDGWGRRYMQLLEELFTTISLSFKPRVVFDWVNHIHLRIKDFWFKWSGCLRNQFNCTIKLFSHYTIPGLFKCSSQISKWGLNWQTNPSGTENRISTFNNTNDLLGCKLCSRRWRGIKNSRIFCSIVCFFCNFPGKQLTERALQWSDTVNKAVSSPSSKRIKVKSIPAGSLAGELLPHPSPHWMWC